MSRFDDPDRRVIPRWRSSVTTARLGELEPARAVKDRIEIPEEDFDRLLAEWKKYGTPSYAADLLGAAVLVSRPDEARDAARLLLGDEASTSRPVRRLAEAVLNPGREDVTSPTLLHPADRHLRIASLKRRTRRTPRNAVAWVDLARHYTTLGQERPAEHAIRVALSLAPHDRFVVRSAVRFLLHTGRAAEAHHLLKRTPRTIHDPWLLASEIASATVVGQTSAFLRRARTMLQDDDIAPSHKSELASALGTVEMSQGTRRKARQLFERSLISANDNALAQVSWASRRHVGPLSVGGEVLATPRTFEVQAWESLRRRQWANGVEATEAWLFDEPFSSRPAVLGSFLTSVVMESYDKAERFALFGLDADPHDTTLWNNLAFARASRGDVEGAEKAYHEISTSRLSDSAKVVHVATGGLISYRRGDFLEGRALYNAAIALAKKMRDLDRVATAMVYQAREEMRVDPRAAVDILRQAEPMIESDVPEGVLKDILIHSYNRVVERAVEQGVLGEEALRRARDTPA